MSIASTLERLVGPELASKLRRELDAVRAAERDPFDDIRAQLVAGEIGTIKSRAFIKKGFYRGIPVKRF